MCKFILGENPTVIFVSCIESSMNLLIERPWNSASKSFEDSILELLLRNHSVSILVKQREDVIDIYVHEAVVTLKIFLRPSLLNINVTSTGKND